jgi:poly(3-hydroxybutyrate) depolymerase
MMEPVRRISTAPVVEHIHIPTSLSTILRRPDPIDEPQSVRENGSVTSATLKVGDMNRDVHFYVPKSESLSHRKPGTLPLMIAFHGSTEHGMVFRASSSSYAYDELACQHGFIIAYPDAYKGKFFVYLVSEFPHRVPRQLE